MRHVTLHLRSHCIRHCCLQGYPSIVERIEDDIIAASIDSSIATINYTDSKTTFAVPLSSLSAFLSCLDLVEEGDLTWTSDEGALWQRGERKIFLLSSPPSQLSPDGSHQLLRIQLSSTFGLWQRPQLHQRLSLPWPKSSGKSTTAAGRSNTTEHNITGHDGNSCDLQLDPAALPAYHNHNYSEGWCH